MGEDASQRRVAFGVDLGDVFSVRTRLLLALGSGRGSRRGRGCYLRGSRLAGQANTEDPCGRCSIPGRVRLGHEVGEGSDRWAPPVGDLGARDPLVSGKKKRGEGAGVGGEAGPRLNVRAGPREKIGSGPRGKIKGEEGVWAFGPKPEGRVLLFLFSISLFF